MAPGDWILGDDTGISSKTIWAVMTGRIMPDPDIPHDPSDFGRCYRLLELFPTWKDRMAEMAEIHPKWGPMVEAWDELTTMYEAALALGADSAPEMYERMREIKPDCMIADGWVQTGPGSWSKQK